MPVTGAKTPPTTPDELDGPAGTSSFGSTGAVGGRPIGDAIFREADVSRKE